ncbi:MAG: HAMP domain-containing sensor histidine kinase [Pirellulales bacterium]
MRKSYRHPTLRLSPLTTEPNRLPPIPSPRLTSVDIFRLIGDVVAQLALPLAQKKITAIIDVPADLFLLADDQMLRTALQHLANNAIEAMPSGGEIVITGVRCHNSVEIEVADSGPGFTDPSSVFSDPTLGEEHSGLSLVRQVAESHGGHITALNCSEGGAALTICLPSRAMRAAA